MNLDVTTGEAIILANLAMLDAEEWKSKSRGKNDPDVFMEYYYLNRKELALKVRKQVDAHELNQSAPQITVNMVSAIKVQFLKPISINDFVERGMTAWLTKVEWDNREQCYKLYFDFSEFEAENDKYFTEKFHPNSKTALLFPKKHLYTAKETGFYNPKLITFFSADSYTTQNSESFAIEISRYLKVI